MILDVLDGMTARMMNAQSEIGKELDSMADLITFGVAPAYLYFLLAPSDGWVYFIPALILLLGSALRLAIFNTIPSKKTFTGLATPAVAFFMFGIFLSYNAEIAIVEKVVAHKTGYFMIPIFLAFMMLCNLEMFSLKGIKKPIYSNYYQILTFSCFLIVLFVQPAMSPLAAVLGYILFSIFYMVTSSDTKQENAAV